jgi:hypothetical protein
MRLEERAAIIQMWRATIWPTTRAADVANMLEGRFKFIAVSTRSDEPAVEEQDLFDSLIAKVSSGRE